MLFEEVKFEPAVMVEELQPSSTLQAAQLDDGDIINCQRALTEVGGPGAAECAGPCMQPLSPGWGSGGECAGPCSTMLGMPVL